MSQHFARLVTALSLSVASLAASAVPIAGLVDTGIGAAAGQQDTNYVFAITSGSATSNGFSYVTADGGFPVNGAWMVNDSVSKWLTPSTTQGQSYDTTVAAGVYTWTLSFDLTGEDAGSASFAARWMSDNSSSVYLNGHLLGSTPTSNASFSSWTDMGTVSSGFVAGVNTLTFVVDNNLAPAPNPTGLRVEFSASNVSPVPEPTSYALMLAGLLAVGSVVRRRRR
ncbi:MAG TPA: PEP-CTERM sorting domain-containing protein [Burkholderiaceae bacterium]|jgi:hypothetical protein